MNKIAITTGMLVLAVLSGCSVFESSGGIVSYSGEINATQDGFRMDGTLSNTGQVDAPQFTNVSVYLVAGNETIIDVATVGSLEESAAVSIRSHATPKYVIINSPDFWLYDDISVSYFELVDGTYTEYVVGSKEEFPVETQHHEQ